MKTPMQELLDLLHTSEDLLGIDYTNIINVIECDLIEKEKYFIMQSYSDGLGNGQAYETNMNPIGSGVLDELHYYNKTFKTN